MQSLFCGRKRRGIRLPVRGLLVTGRRGPFPTYRVNGVYAPSGESTWRRIDRSEVEITFEDDKWQCALEGKLIACGKEGGAAEFGEGDMLELDHNVLMLRFEKPVGVRLAELPAPGLPSAAYVLWGTEGTADALCDLVQGDIGNCGALCAIDAWADKDPQWHLGAQLRSLDGDSVSKVTANLFDLCTGKLQTLVLDCSLHCEGDTAVPTYARTLSHRAWGVLMEYALADISGGYQSLHLCEPGVVWLSLGGRDAAPRRYVRSLTGGPDIGTTWVEAVAYVNRAAACCAPTKRQRWRAAWHWRPTGRCGWLCDAEIEQLLESHSARGWPICMYVDSHLQASQEAGEPCVKINVDFSDVLSATDLVSSRFVLGHAYSVRAVTRLDGELWLQLRDPRLVHLFWFRWADAFMLKGPTGFLGRKVFLYLCMRPNDRGTMDQGSKKHRNIE